MTNRKSHYLLSIDAKINDLGCSPMTLDSGNIRFMQIFVVVLEIYVNFPQIYVCLI